MFASLLKSKVSKEDRNGNLKGWALYWSKRPHSAEETQQKNKNALSEIHSSYLHQAARDTGHTVLESIEHTGTKTSVKTPNAFKLGQGVIDHLASKGFERKDMARNGMDSIYTMQHPKTNEKVKVGYFHGFGKTLSGKGMPSRVEISHVSS